MHILLLLQAPVLYQELGKRCTKLMMDNIGGIVARQSHSGILDHPGLLKELEAVQKALVRHSYNQVACAGLVAEPCMVLGSRCCERFLQAALSVQVHMLKQN